MNLVGRLLSNRLFFDSPRDPLRIWSVRPPTLRQLLPMFLKVFKLVRYCLVLLAVSLVGQSERLPAGPLAEAVAQAKAAAGVAADPEAEPPAAAHPPRDPKPAAAAAEPVGNQQPDPAKPATVTLELRLPITGNRDTQLRAAILRQLDRLQSRSGQRGVLVLQFASDRDSSVAGSDFGRSLELARFLTDPRLAGVRRSPFCPREPAAMPSSRRWPAKRS